MGDLVSLEEYKTYKGIATSENDGRILQIITHVSQLVRSFCNRSFTGYYDTDKVEYYDGSLHTLYPEEVPLVSVTSVEVSDDGGETYTAQTEFTGYYVDRGKDAVTTGYPNYPFSTSAYSVNGVRLTYKGGFEECPEDLKIACFDIVEYYREEEYIPKKVMSGATSDNEVFRLMRSERFPIHIQRVLNLYRMVV
jgi:hypothetical protein